MAEPGALRKAQRVLDALRARAGSDLKAAIDSENDFPTAAGIASSASGLAALAAAAALALGLELTPAELSVVARLGSGSAARSIFGGFVEMHPGERADGSDAIASPLLAPDAWPLSVLVVVTCDEKKRVASTAGMERTQDTSPFWPSFVAEAPRDLAAMRSAIAARDFTALGELAEHSAMKLHALALSTRPALLYWNAATVSVMHAVGELRRGGFEAYFTIDAGPQVKVLCQPAAAAHVRATLATIAGVHRIIDSRPGDAVVTQVVAS